MKEKLLVIANNNAKDLTFFRLSLQTVHQNDYEQDPYAKEFGITIDNKLASVEARVLPAPWVMFKATLLLHVTFRLVLPTKLFIVSIFFFDSLSIMIVERKKNSCLKLDSGI